MKRVVLAVCLIVLAVVCTITEAKEITAEDLLKSAMCPQSFSPRFNYPSLEQVLNPVGGELTEADRLRNEAIEAMTASASSKTIIMIGPDTKVPAEKIPIIREKLSKAKELLEAKCKNPAATAVDWYRLGEHEWMSVMIEGILAGKKPENVPTIMNGTNLGWVENPNVKKAMEMTTDDRAKVIYSINLLLHHVSSESFLRVRSWSPENQKRFTETKATLEKIADGKNPPAECLDALGSMTLLETDDLGKANGFYKKALERDPTHTNSLDAYIKYLWSKHKYRDAAKMARVATEKNSRCPVGHRLLIASLAMDNKLDEAAKAAMAGQDASEAGDEEYMGVIAYLCLRLGDVRNGISLLEKMRSRECWISYDLGIAYAVTGDKEKAIENLRSAVLYCGMKSKEGKMANDLSFALLGLRAPQ